MTDGDWNNGESRAVGVLLDGDAIAEVDAHGQRIVGDTLLMLFNAASMPVTFTLPERGPATHWEVLADTADPESLGPPITGPTRMLLGRSAVVLRLTL